MENSKKRIKLLIIGGSGNIGRDLLPSLEGNFEIRAWFRDKNRTIPLKHIKWSKVDITKPSRRYIIDLKWADKVLYLAGTTGMNDPRSYDINVKCFENIIKNLNKSKNINFIYFSTIEAHGPTGETVTVIGQVDEPINIYGRSKLEAEKIIEKYSLTNPLFSYYILRLGNVSLINNYQAILNNYFLKNIFGNYEITNLSIEEIVKAVNILLTKFKLSNQTRYLTGKTIGTDSQKSFFWKLLEMLVVNLMRLTKKGGFWYYLSEGGRVRSKRRYSEIIYQELNII